MTTFFLDTSALLKHYIDELGSTRVRALIQESPGPLIISTLTRVELACAFARREREGTLTSVIRQELWRAFQFDSAHRLSFIKVGPLTLTAAEQLAFRNPLRAYDAVQLASAVFANRRLRRTNRQELVFVCADSRLLEIARTEGFAVLNPNEPGVA